jgi:hypothetical protein
MTRLIDADALCEEFKERQRAALRWKEKAILDGDEEISIRADATLSFLSEVKLTIDNAPTVKVPENEVNCVLTMFGECSYDETGCSDCKIKEHIRKALKNERPKGKWLFNGNEWECSRCKNIPWYNKSPMESNYDFCPYCGADMREADDDPN